MDKTAWKRRITKACKDAGTYRKYFSDTIDTLAGIMEIRDAALEKFEESGSEPVVEHTNKNGSVNATKNPSLVIVLDLQTQALNYWRDLGLTPAGMKRIDEKAIKLQQKQGAAEVFKGILA